MYLADMGAEVIHVESPTRPDLVRIMPPYANGQATAHSYLNRNKQSIALDLKEPNNIELIKIKFLSLILSWNSSVLMSCAV